MMARAPLLLNVRQFGKVHQPGKFAFTKRFGVFATLVPDVSLQSLLRAGDFEKKQSLYFNSLCRCIRGLRRLHCYTHTVLF